MYKKQPKKKDYEEFMDEISKITYKELCEQEKQEEKSSKEEKE